MRAFWAIVKQTIRSSVRSKVFHVLFALILLAVFLLPVTVSGDGTAMGQLQIALTYSLGVVVALISTTTLWLSCALLSREIENYSLHMVTVKPCPRWLVWLGKWFGVFLMHAIILTVSAAIIFGLIMWRVHRAHFSDAEMRRLENEVLVGRRSFLPEMPDFVARAEAEYEKRKAEGSLQADHSPSVVKGEILRQLKAKTSEVAPGMSRFWAFRNVKIPRDRDVVFLRYRHYAGSTSRNSQRMLRGIWAIRDPSSVEDERFVPVPQEEMSGVFHELKIPPMFIDRSQGGLVVIGYSNPPKEEQLRWEGAENEDDGVSVMFQPGDGPMLLVRVTGFLSNYLRSMLLAMLQVAFLAALGCTVGAAFSTPVAAFVAITYLVIGMSVEAAVNAPLKDELGHYEYKGFLDKAAHQVARGVRMVVVSVDDLDATSDLARGRLIEGSRIGRAMVSMIGIRGGLIALIGMWVLTRRELGAVIRR